MRTVTVEVPVEVIVEFAHELSTTDFDHRISGTTPDDEIEIDIFYEKHQAGEIDALEEYLAILIQNI